MLLESPAAGKIGVPFVGQVIAIQWLRHVNWRLIKQRHWAPLDSCSPLFSAQSLRKARARVATNAFGVRRARVEPLVLEATNSKRHFVEH